MACSNLSSWRSLPCSPQSAMSAVRSALATATATALACSQPKWARLICGSRNSVLAASCPRSWNPAGVSVSGPLRRCYGGLRGRRLHPQDRSPGRRSRQPERDLKIPGQPHLRRHRRAGAGLPQPATGCQWLRLLNLDATYLHGRLGRAMQVCSRAVGMAIGVNADGRRELLGLKVGDSESELFWSEFIGSLKERALTGAKLVISEPTAASPTPSSGCSRAAAGSVVEFISCGTPPLLSCCMVMRRWCTATLATRASPKGPRWHAAQRSSGLQCGQASAERCPTLQKEGCRI